MGWNATEIVQGVQSGMVSTGQCSQWGYEQGRWCKLDQREEEVVEWDLALGMNRDIGVESAKIGFEFLDEEFKV